MRLVDIKITEAQYLRDYIIRFTFSDRTVQNVNFEKWIKLNYGGSKKYLNKRLFKKFEILYGKNISWNDYEMCFPFIFLYREHRKPSRIVLAPYKLDTNLF